MRFRFYFRAIHVIKCNTELHRANQFKKALQPNVTTIIGAAAASVLLLVSLHSKANSVAMQDNEQNTRPAKQTPAATVLTLQAAIEGAQAKDEWLLKSNVLESRLMQLSEGAGALPDPTFSIALLNLPTDNLAFDQEAMTQLKVGASQMFPRGDSLALKQKRLQLAAAEQPYLRINRRKKIALQASQLWLDAYKASASYKLIAEARPLFDNLGEIVKASYASSLGKANQQDIIRAELELVRLEDRLIGLKSEKDIALSRLSQFLWDGDNHSWNANTQQHLLPESLAELTEKQSKQLSTILKISAKGVHTLVTGHPLLAASEQEVQASKVDIDIAEQAYKPQYGLNASYALRDDARSGDGGQHRADFFSIGLSVSLPLFSTAQQDANVSSARLMTEAVRTEKRLIMRDLVAGLTSAFAAYQGASSRLSVYEQQILPQISQQAQAALNAYTNDIGDFAEVVRAKIDELDAQLTRLDIRVKQHKALVNIEYFYSEGGNTHE